jgi:hypothetical protein
MYSSYAQVREMSHVLEQRSKRDSFSTLPCERGKRRDRGSVERKNEASASVIAVHSPDKLRGTFIHQAMLSAKMVRERDEFPKERRFRFKVRRHENQTRIEATKKESIMSVSSKNHDTRIEQESRQPRGGRG